MADTVVRMPKLADTLVEGTVGRWLKHVGDEVRPGEPLVSIETDKVTTDLTSPAAGTLAELFVAEGATVPVETPIARIGDSTVEASPSDLSALPALSKTLPKPTPVAARILAEHGLQPTVIDTNSRRITKRQVLQYIDGQHPAESRPSAPAETQQRFVPLTRMRAAIADHMAQAKRSIPHGQTVMRGDLTDLVAWRELSKDPFQQANDGAGLTYTVLFVAALARALVQRQVARRGEAHIGVAVALDGGLIVPVIRGADQQDIGGIARALRDLGTRARAGALQTAETQEAAMTLSNVGSFGNLFAAPIIPLNQHGILGPGVVEQRPLPHATGAIRFGYTCLFTLMFDRSRMTDLDADRLLRLTLELLLELPKDAHRWQHVGHA